MSGPVRISRRAFLAVAGASAGGALVLGVRTFAEAESTRLEGGPSFTPNMWLSISTTGETSIWVAKAEMGQGVHTSLPMIVAEELDIDLSRVRVVQALVEPRFATFLGTGGSSSVMTSFEPLRQAGATARSMLVAAAADMWNVPVAECSTEPGVVIHAASGRRTAYESLVEAASHLPVPAVPISKDPATFRLIGKKIPRLDTPPKVDGSAVYGIDVRTPGLLFAVVARCPVYGGKVASFDGARAKKAEGVRHVMPFGDAGVAVVAETTWAALEGRRALEVQWNEGTNVHWNSEEIAKFLAERGTQPAMRDRDDGNVDEALEKCHREFTATYTTPFVAHAPIEPVNTTVSVRRDGCEIWGPLQYADGVQQDAAQITGLPPSAITVHTTFLGGGLGRKAESDFATDAILLSKALGQPVQLLYSREDDTAHDHFRPTSRHWMRAGIDGDGKLIAWSHRIVAPSLRQQWEWGRKAEDIQRGLDKWATEPPNHVAYRAPNFRVEYVMAQTPVPVGAWRSIYASQTAFADECFVDELATALGKDPVAFRLELIGQTSPLHRSVLERAAREAGWGKPLPQGRSRGVAVYRYGSNSTYVAEVAEVSVDPDGRVRVHRVVCAVDGGMIVNPGIVEAQIEGAILYGLSAALSGEITFARGRCQQSNFHDAPLLRFSETPSIEVHILKNERPPTGIGEPGVPPIAPAVANAVSAAIGNRIRELPLTPARIAAARQLPNRKAILSFEEPAIPRLLS
jgi:isoquinoline 1-oxidoreductase subunit beta